MRRRHLILGGLFVLLVGAVALRWPRLEPGMVAVTRSEVRGDQMVVEYRMSRPFEVALAHGIRRPIKWTDGVGIHVGSWTPLRQEEADFIASTYDLVRGEHSVHLAFQRGPALTVESNGRRLELSAWLAPDASSVKWLPPGQGVRHGENLGKDILHFGASSEQEEYLILYAGTDVRRWVK